MPAFRHPVVAVSHGPGALWLLSSEIFGMSKKCRSAKALQSLFEKLCPDGKNLPKRILVVSAHFEAVSEGFEISKAAKPDIIFDYYGLPAEAYDLLLGTTSRPSCVDHGFDHGVFVPMLLIRPQCDIPIVSMSINSQLDSKAHFDLRRALAAFRDDGTLIICSGQSTHNVRGVHYPSRQALKGAEVFQDWLDNTLASGSELNMDERAHKIQHWETAPAARLAHPTANHFLPFVVAAGAGMEEDNPGAERVFGGWGMSVLSFANYVWGSPSC
ncbi:hypothetical protein V7S43_000740 [Phytophthora oleae]|uniref:Extradiol ring-cleavage dioxygenase class III enzyme subunit B domain-containing protein n=1 Tax=Phytophthora oleae TaxID=2107226 RepID=A0ABD3G758_9STRA